jgi:hypothetical protein
LIISVRPTAAGRFRHEICFGIDPWSRLFLCSAGLVRQSRAIGDPIVQIFSFSHWTFKHFLFLSVQLCKSSPLCAVTHLRWFTRISKAAVRFSFLISAQRRSIACFRISRSGMLDGIGLFSHNEIGRNWITLHLDWKPCEISAWLCLHKDVRWTALNRADA